MKKEKYFAVRKKPIFFCQFLNFEVTFMRLEWTKNKSSTTYRALKTIRVNGKNKTVVVY